MMVKMRQAGLPDAQAPGWVTDDHLQFVQRNEEELDEVMAMIAAMGSTD